MEREGGRGLRIAPPLPAETKKPRGEGVAWMEPPCGGRGFGGDHAHKGGVAFARGPALRAAACRCGGS